jgi:glycerol kinase
VEHDAENIFDSVKSCIRNLGLTETDAIKSIGITNQRETVVAWSRKSGKTLHNCLVWLDTRTHDAVQKEASTSELGVNKYRKITGLPLSTYFSASKIQWLIDNVSSVEEALASGDCCFGTIDSYLTYRLTGGMVHVTDVANASRYNLMDLESLQWSESVCTELGIPLRALPRIVSNAEEVGRVDSRVIPSLGGIPITALIGDQHAALVGHGCTSENMSKVTYGTGCFLLMNTGRSMMHSEGGELLTTMAYRLGPAADPVYALEGSVASAGRSVEWAKENLRIGQDLLEFNAIAASVPDTCGVTFVPAFSGLFAPYWREDARAVIVGMSLKASYRHIARAILEATALQCADIAKLFEGNPPFMVADGGMTKSDLLMQMQSDLCNVPIHRARMHQATAFGAAYCAGLSVGFWEGKNVNEIKAMQEGYDEFVPRMSELDRAAAFERWHDAVLRSFDLAKFSR